MSAVLSSFGNLKTDAGLSKLDAHMLGHSYVEGFQASPADVQAVASMVGLPNASKFPNAARWYSHITSFTEAERNAWGKCICAEAKAEVKAAEKTAKKTDDDLDLFGSDDDEDAAAVAATLAKKKAEMAAASEKKEKKEKKKEVAKSQLFWDVRPRVGEDITKLEEEIKKITMDGLVWGVKVATEPLAYGLVSVKMTCIIEDEKIKTDDIERAMLSVGLSDKMVKERLEAWDQGLDFEEEDECPITSVKLASMSKV